MKLTSIPALQDNYIWMLNDEQGQCLIVDPGDAFPVLKMLTDNQWQPVAILLTHHHNDHTGGVKDLLKNYPHLVVYGPEETQVKGASNIVREGDQLSILGQEFTIFSTPGHTSGHISYFNYPYLFCGDTLFSGGCGKLLGGTIEQLYESFQIINALPEDTLICCAHEYTLSNIKFALSILPDDKALHEHYRKVKELREKNHSTLPTLLSTEREINLFLRIHNVDLKQKINEKIQLQQPQEIFAWLRAKKDHF